MNEKNNMSTIAENAEIFTEQLNALNLSSPTSFDILTLAAACIKIGENIAQGEA